MRNSFLALVLLVGMAVSAGLTTISSTTDGIELRLASGAVETETVSLRGSQFSRLSMEGAEGRNEFGLPVLPAYRAWIEVPAGAEVTVDVTPLRIEQVSAPAAPVEPGIRSAPKSRPRGEFEMALDPRVYSEGESFPESWARVIDGGMMRGRHVVLVEVTPLRWTPGASQMDLLAAADIQVSYQGGDMAETDRLAEHFSSPYYDRFLERQLVNYGTFSFDGGFDSPPSPYLIVGHSDFVDTGMDDFVSWKESLGFDVTVADLDETGGSASEIEAYILDAIENWADPPEFVLLVGDTGYLPGNSATEYGGVTDLYYVALDDGGYFPDAFIGRFSVNDVGEAVLMADRVIDYEQNVGGSDDWIQNTCWIASNDNYNISEGTHNYCIDNYLDPLGYTWDKVYPVTYGSSADDAIESINGGVSMLTFSGHGSQTSWGDMSFGSGDFAQLNNEGMFPGVLSHSCLTGDYEVATAWCETWTRTPGRGGLWFWGSVPSTYWDEDDIQEKAEYEWFLGGDRVEWPMGFLGGGLLAVYEYYSGGGRSKYYYEGYNLMGDPSVDMWVWGEETGVEGSETHGGLGSSLAVSSPNPIMAGARVRLSGSGYGRLEVYDVAGRLVATPYVGELSNNMSVEWDASGLRTGVYFLRLRQGDTAATAKVTLIR